MKVISQAIILISILFLQIACTDPVEKKLPASSVHTSAWIKYAGNPILRPGYLTTNSNDYYSLSDSCVLKVTNIYKIWYTASGFTSITANNHAAIHYAESSNGIDWIKYTNNPVIDITTNGWDAFAIETITVLIDHAARATQRYKAWYCGKITNAGLSAKYDIGYATSSNGIHWTKYAGNPVLIKGSASEWDNEFIEGPTVIYDSGTYKMWYAGLDTIANSQPTDGKVSIGYATSPDGINWTKYPGNPVLTVGSSGSWDSITVQDPCVIQDSNGFHMWYGGKDATYAHYGQQTGYAYSADGTNWTKSGNNPVLMWGSASEWDHNTASYPTVLVESNTLKMWYTGKEPDFPASLPYYWELGYAERPIINGTLSE